MTVHPGGLLRSAPCPPAPDALPTPEQTATRERWVAR
jgi:hypothetical protein